MHTQAQPTEGMFPSLPTRAERRQMASMHAALFPTQLALARWQHGGHVPPLQGHEHGSRAAWFATARNDFQAWLDCGGFVQHDGDDDGAICPAGLPLLGGKARHVDAC